MGLHVSKYIPAEKQAEALNFIKWFQTPEAQKKWAQLGGVPARNDVLTSPEFLEAQPYNKVFTESVPRLKDFWNLPEYAKLLNVHSTAGQRGHLRHREARRGARQARRRRAGHSRRERPLSSELKGRPGSAREPGRLNSLSPSQPLMADTLQTPPTAPPPVEKLEAPPAAKRFAS